MDLYEYDDSLRKRDNVQVICGVDEAGRGPLAGDVYAAAVILDAQHIEDINDSKKLTEKRRTIAYENIVLKSISYNIGIATVEEIEEHNILGATMLAMSRAVEGLTVTPEIVYIDGNRCPKTLEIPCKTIIKGDTLSASIAAASILAKVSRDLYMTEMSKIYPKYEFDRHKGYGTKLHYDRLREHGPCDIHRKSFLKNLH